MSTPLERSRQQAGDNPTLAQLQQQCTHPSEEQQSSSIDGWKVESCAACGYVMSQIFGF